MLALQPEFKIIKKKKGTIFETKHILPYLGKRDKNNAGNGWWMTGTGGRTYVRCEANEKMLEECSIDAFCQSSESKCNGMGQHWSERNNEPESSCGQCLLGQI